MPDSLPTPTSFRVALRSLVTSPLIIAWAPPNHPANGLLEAMAAAPENLPECWAWLKTFDLNDVAFLSRGMNRTVGGTLETTRERVRLTSRHGDEVLICHNPDTTLSTDDLARLTNLLMFVTGGMGQSAEEIDALLAAEAEDQAAQEEAVKDELSAEGAKALRLLVDALTTCVAPPNAPLSLHPLRRDEPSDLMLGDCTLRVYDRNSHTVARFLLNLGQKLRAGVHAVVAQGRP